jgi:hypothetical protein
MIATLRNNARGKSEKSHFFYPPSPTRILCVQVAFSLQLREKKLHDCFRLCFLVHHSRLPILRPSLLNMRRKTALFLKLPIFCKRSKLPIAPGTMHDTLTDSGKKRRDHERQATRVK